MPKLENIWCSVLIYDCLLTDLFFLQCSVLLPLADCHVVAVSLLLVHSVLTLPAEVHLKNL